MSNNNFADKLKLKYEDDFRWAKIQKSSIEKMIGQIEVKFNQSNDLY